MSTNDTDTISTSEKNNEETRYNILNHRGYFQERSHIDLFDKSWSMPIFKCYLGQGEYLLSIPANWFGFPLLFSLGTVPIIGVSLLNETSELFKYKVATPLLATMTVWWFKQVRESRRLNCNLDTEGLMKCWYPGGKKIEIPIFLAIPNIVYAITKFTSENGCAFVSFFLISWYSVQIFLDLIKIMSQRVRPVISLKDELKEIPRYIHQIRMRLKKRDEVNKAFPSGDVAAAAIWATAISMFLQENSSNSAFTNFFLMSIVALTAFGRMYFHAHHALDVTVGALVGYIGPKLLRILFGMRNFYWKHILIMQMLFVIVYLIMNKKLKPHFINP